MKTSYYNFFRMLKDGNVLAFNARTCAMVEINQEYMDLLKKVEIGDCNLSDNEMLMISELKENGFIVDDEINELENLKYKHNREKYNRNFMSVTIAPTMECNFACKYCFEERKPGRISEEVKNNFLSFIQNNLKQEDHLEINWYGGEPLLAIDDVEDFANRVEGLCKRKRCQFTQNMVSNGYLVDADMAARLKKLGLETLQITLDGAKDIHNSRRMLRDGKTGSFDKIITGLKAAVASDLDVVIRINIDKTNFTGIRDLLSCLKENEIEKVKIAYGHVLPYTNNCEDYSDNCFTKEEFADVVLDIQSMMVQEKFLNESVIYPSPKLTYCCACNVNSFLLDVDGDMYKCWCDVGNKDEAFSNISNYDSLQDEDQNENLLKWLNKTPFEDAECVKCKLLPICMGGCPKMGKEEANGKCCDLWKYNIENMMRCTYNYYCSE